MIKNNCRVKQYRVTYGDGFTELRNFTQVQADSVDAVLELDGIGIKAARSLVDRWNLQAKIQGNPYSYSIPFSGKAQNDV